MTEIQPEEDPEIRRGRGEPDSFGIKDETRRDGSVLKLLCGAFFPESGRFPRYPFP